MERKRKRRERESESTRTHERRVCVRGVSMCIRVHVIIVYRYLESLNFVCSVLLVSSHREGMFLSVERRATGPSPQFCRQFRCNMCAFKGVVVRKNKKLASGRGAYVYVGAVNVSVIHRSQRALK